ncbi:MAG: sorbosone dehydrogenase family protein [Woeseiaceae bacterium]|nr:sorbosone dehydrogenase family protein [Woeseiaceae bacterium]
MQKTIVMLLSVLATILSPAACAQSELDLSEIRLPPGFTIEVWSDEVPNARSLALGANGTVFVATRRDGRVYALLPQGSGKPAVVTLANNLTMPNGVAFHDGALYVAENHRITRYPGIEQSLPEVPEPELVTDKLTTDRHHGWRYIDFGPDGKLYIALGAPCNVCEREGYANISRMNPDGSGLEVVAYGVRNSVGFTWHPETGDLWFTDNGRDMLGDDVPPGELNHVRRDGLHFGFPYCHGGDIQDPEFGDRGDCADFEPPAQKLGPHVAPLGVLFYDGDMFPEEYRGQAFIAEHGSWNRSQKIGYRVSLVRMQGGRAVGYEVFADGWLDNEQVSGRPVDLLVQPDGSMLLSDDLNGVIYRIAYARPMDDGVAVSFDDADSLQ